MLKNAPTLAIVAVHTEENEPPKFWRPECHYIIPILNYSHIPRNRVVAKGLPANVSSGGGYFRCSRLDQNEFESTL